MLRHSGSARDPFNPGESDGGSRRTPVIAWVILGAVVLFLGVAAVNAGSFLPDLTQRIAGAAQSQG